MTRKLKVILFLTMVSSVLAAEERNEIGLLLGAKFTPGQAIRSGAPAAAIDIGKGLTLQATYARRLTPAKGAALYLEIPFVATPSTDVSSSNTTLPRNFANIFITPSLRVALAPGKKVTPWFSAGGGYGRYDESTSLISGAANPGRTGTTTGVLQFGGGVDLQTPIHILLPIGVRLEVRDFYAGKPNYNVATGGTGQHNVVASGGLVLKF